MLDVPERTPAADDWNTGKIVFGGRRGGGPFEGPGVPGIVACRRALEHGIEEIADKNKRPNNLEENADGDDEIPDFPAAARLVSVDSPRHAEKARNMHEIEGEMETDEEEPEMEFAKFFVVEAAAHFREPVVEGTEDGEEDGANDDVVEMSDDEIRGAELPIKRNSRKHDASEAGDEELEQECNAEEHGSFEDELAAPHGAEPIENFDSGGNRNDHGGQGKGGVAIGTHPNREHVMGPNAHADETDGDSGADHDGIAEDGLAGEDGDDFRSEGKTGDDQDVDLRVAENPEEMHPQDGGAASLSVKEVRAEETIESEHHLGGRKGRNDDEHQASRDQVEPGQKRHLAEGHAGTTEAKDGGNKVDAGADAAEPGNEEAERPEICAVAQGKGLCRERGVRKPANVGRGANAIEAVAADETEVQKKATESGKPEAEGIEARKGHVSRANHERKEVIAEAEQDRHGDKKDHGGAMHGEHLIEELRGDEMVVGNDELDAHDGGFNATDYEEEDGVEDIEDAEALVVNGGDPGIEEVAKGARRLVHGSEGNGFRGHAGKTSVSLQGLQIGGHGFQVVVA